MDVNNLMIKLNYAMLPVDQPVRVLLVFDGRGLDKTTLLKSLVDECAKYLELDDLRKPILEITIAIHGAAEHVDMSKVDEVFHRQIAQAQIVDPLVKRLGRIYFRIQYVDSVSEAHAINVQAIHM